MTLTVPFDPCYLNFKASSIYIVWFPSFWIEMLDINNMALHLNRAPNSHGLSLYKILLSRTDSCSLMNLGCSFLWRGVHMCVRAHACYACCVCACCLCGWVSGCFLVCMHVCGAVDVGVCLCACVYVCMCIWGWGLRLPNHIPCTLVFEFWSQHPQFHGHATLCLFGCNGILVFTDKRIPQMDSLAQVNTIISCNPYIHGF